MGQSKNTYNYKLNYHCPVHCDRGCNGDLITKVSTLGARTTLCESAWGPDLIIDMGYGDHRSIFIDPALWTEVGRVCREQ